jgi:hypothetical protein
MARRWRWLVVLVGVGMLLATPSLVGALPGRAAAVPAGDLLARIHRSGRTPYSGYATATGALSLPVTGQFDSVARLLGGTTQLRVWWRGARDWRVDSIAATGETGQHRTPTALWTWDYDSNRATLEEVVVDPRVRLPVAADLLPSGLAERLLTDATTAEVTSLPSRRIAGRDTEGLRLRPVDRRTTVDHVDVWADAASAIPLRVDVVGVRSTAPTMTAEFTDFSTAVPPASVTAFSPPTGSRVRQRVMPDLVAFLSRFSAVVPPATLAGLPRNDRRRPDGAVGLYGRGVTEVVAIPIPPSQAAEVRRQLATAPGVADTPQGLALAVGPVGLLLSRDDDTLATAWLLTGTVTEATLTAAAGELRRTARAAS